MAYLSLCACLSVWSILAAKHQGQFFRCFTQFTIGPQAELMALDILPVNCSDLIISAILHLQFHYYFQNNWKSSAHILDTFVPAWSLVSIKSFQHMKSVCSIQARCIPRCGVERKMIRTFSINLCKLHKIKNWPCQSFFI